MWHRKTGLDGHQRNRRWWLDVGTALIEGKDKDNRKVGQKFSEWVQEMFPGLTDSHDIADAMWLATNFVTVTENADGLTHPSRIRRAFSEQQATAEEQRVLWLEIGNALAVGRMKNPSNQKFGQWCTAAGFVFSDVVAANNNIRADAMWLAAHWDFVLTNCENAALRPEVTAGLDIGIAHNGCS